MGGARPQPSVLSEAVATFIQRFVSVIVSSRNAENAPSVARACGCRVSADRREVTVFLSTTQAATLLSHLRETSAVAVVFSQPSTHKTVQLKGSDARLGPLSPGDEALIEAYRESFVQDLHSVGYSQAFAAAVVPRVDAGTLTLTFTPTSAFDQTPGRNAGRALE